MGDGPGAECLGPRPVGDRPRHLVGRPRHDLAALQGVAGVRGELRLHADHPCLGMQLADRHRYAARQPAATDRHEHRGQVGEILGDLEPDRTLARDDAVVVERRDDSEPAARGDLERDLVALLAGRPDDHDLRAVLLDPRALDGRGVGRHHDDRRSANEPGRSRHALAVIPRRVRDESAGELLARQSGDRGIRTAQLECADGLE